MFGLQNSLAHDGFMERFLFTFVVIDGISELYDIVRLATFVEFFELFNMIFIVISKFYECLVY